jgi:hypothetical protein
MTVYDNPQGIATLSIQGQLVDLKISQTGQQARPGKKLLKLFARFEFPGNAVFVTLTYPAEFPAPDEAKKHLRAFLERIRRKCEENAVSGVWRLELQERGAPHFHLILFGLPYISKETIRGWWSEIIGYCAAHQLKSGEWVEGAFTRIEMISSRRRLTAYVSKYVAKAGASGGFNHASYLHASLGYIHPETGEVSHPGRWWGVFNALALPFAALFRTEVEAFSRPIYQLKRYMRRHYANVSKKHTQGGFIFTRSAGAWSNLWWHCLVT